MFQSRRGHDAQSVANTNGNTNTTIELPPNMDHGSLQEPRPAFDEFVYANFLDHPERHPDCDNQADLVNLARHTWKNMDAAEKEPWKSRYARDYKAYSERLEAVNQRIIEHQASRAEPRPEEQEAQVGSGGGFTAVNS